MIISFSGDEFLATREARRALREQGLESSQVQELGEGMDARSVLQEAQQGGLFARVGLLLDFAAAFRGQSGTKPRNEVMKALESVPDGALVVVLDPAATPARQKRLAQLGEHKHLPTPRFGSLTRWVEGELKDAGIDFTRDVPDVLVDLFGEDLPGIASEIQKLGVLRGKIDGERVRSIVGRLASRDAFDLIEATTSGDAAAALEVCGSLVAQGEAPPRVIAALIWQYELVARAVAALAENPRLGDSQAGAILGAKPFVARKALGIARRLDESRLRHALETILAADLAIKRGRDERWSLEEMALELCAVQVA